MSEQSENLLLAHKRTDLARERNSLANERTFLAWLRTGIGGIGGGVAIIRLLDFQNATHRLIADWTGYVLIFWGIVIIILALLDYRNRRNHLNFKTGYAGSTTFLAMLVGTLVVACLALFVVIFFS